MELLRGTYGRGSGAATVPNWARDAQAGGTLFGFVRRALALERFGYVSGCFGRRPDGALRPGFGNRGG
jgi:hypothetical protein